MGPTPLDDAHIANTNMTRCPVCHLVMLETEVFDHCNRLHAPTPPTPFVRCPICNSVLPEPDMADHCDRLHPPQPPASRRHSIPGPPMFTPMSQLPMYISGAQPDRISVPSMHYAQRPPEYWHRPVRASSPAPIVGSLPLSPYPQSPFMPAARMNSNHHQDYLHYCGACKRVRGSRYQRDHPLMPGQFPKPSECKGCWLRRDRPCRHDYASNSSMDVQVGKSSPSLGPIPIRMGNHERTHRSHDDRDRGTTIKRSHSTHRHIVEEHIARDRSRERGRTSYRKIPDSYRHGYIDSIIDKLSDIGEGDKITVIRRRSRSRRREVDQEPRRSRKSPGPRSHRKSSRRLQPTAQTQYPVRTKGNVKIDPYESTSSSSESSFSRQTRLSGWHQNIRHVPAGQTSGQRIGRVYEDDTPMRSPLWPSSNTTAGHVRLPSAPKYTYREYRDHHNTPPSDRSSNPPYPLSELGSGGTHGSRHVRFEEVEDNEFMTGANGPAD